MQEKDFRAKLVKEFKPGPGRFIWTFDAHFKSGFPDVFWKIDGRNTHHMELKLCKKDNLPVNPWDLCTKIQTYIIQQLDVAGAHVGLLVMHKPTKGDPGVYFFKPRQVFGQRWTVEHFWDWWREVTRD